MNNLTKEKPKFNVVAALIFDGDKFLICQRPHHKARGGLWEFVGGKVEQAEDLRSALKRECFEELNISIEIEDLYFTVTHHYEDIDIVLYLFKAKISGGALTLLEHIDAKWITASEIDNFDFCPADYKILDKIKSDFTK